MNVDVRGSWKDENFLSENLIIKDIEHLLEYITPWLKDMEKRFSWDYSVNDMGLSYFINIAMGKIYEIVNADYKNEYELYLKQMDFYALWDVVSEYPIEDSVGKNDNIWELVRDKILEISREVLS